ncbi:hypothetical protein RRSWK_04472 [Rhodopirellula sp. SWK7]|nr:hypothetical protein RRSWK_04472 [Rhodopirellula sp. SWK7]
MLCEFFEQKANEDANDCDHSQSLDQSESLVGMSVSAQHVKESLEGTVRKANVVMESVHLGRTHAMCV